MALQFIHDDKGTLTGVFVPIEEWETILAKFAEECRKKNANGSKADCWEQQTIQQKLNDYFIKHH
jgi:hypothetical protein